MSDKSDISTIMFLGAGASVPFDIPDSRKIVDEVQAKIWRHSKRIKQIRKRIVDFGLTDDIESVLSILSFWSDPAKTIRESGSFLAEITNRAISSFVDKSDDSLVALRVKEYIVRRCFVKDPDIINSIVKIYSGFFQGLHQKFSLPECSPKGKSRCPSLDIFTTNYDNVIEEFCRRNGTPTCDGYNEYIKRNYVFDQHTYEKAAYQIRLYKLHGTVTYARLENNGIDRVSYIPKQGHLTIGGVTAFPDLIYPGIQTCLAREPQLELFYLLKMRLLEAQTCVVIGYSFGDAHIKQIFKDVCTKKQDLKIFLVSPEASQTLNVEKLNGNQFIAIDRKFEELDTGRDLVLEAGEES
jgi:hypothetical protein